MPRKRKRNDHAKLIGYTRVHPASRANAKPKRVHVTNGCRSSALLEAPLDARTIVGKAYKRGLAELKAHLNNDVSVPESKLIDQAVRLGLLGDLSWGEITKAEALTKDGEPIPSINIFLRASKAQRDVLALLGIKRKPKQADLSSYITSRGEVFSVSPPPEEEPIDEPA
jgi:hypothetical protein